jgi:hypothetical protein
MPAHASLLPPRFATLGVALALSAAVGCAKEPLPPRAQAASPLPLSQVVIERAPDARLPPFRFSPDDEAFLDEVQRGCFNFFWNAGLRHSDLGMVPDRSSKPTVSIAGLGFQLSALCVGVERGWVPREDAFERARRILTALRDNPDNKKAGLFFHYIHPQSAGQPSEAYEHVVSTIDSALLFAGILTASQYFGGEVRSIGDALFADANWKFFIDDHAEKPWERGYISLGWKPDNLSDPAGAGKILPYYWADCGDEHRLVTFLAVAAPREEHRADPALYYKLRRQIGHYQDAGPMVYFPWSGALFVSFFAHCWIDYRAIGTDDPSAFNVHHRPRVDFWENARRTVRLHQLKCEANPRGLATLGPNAWGLSASDVASGYAVPGLFPDPLPMPGARPQYDYPVFTATDNFGDGTLAPYAAGSAIMFDPERAIAALRHYRALKAADGSPLLWSDPARGGYGFRDAYNLSAGAKPWVAEDYVAIDQGPLLLAIENARTGLLWKLFHGHETVRQGLSRLGLQTVL